MISLHTLKTPAIMIACSLALAGCTESFESVMVPRGDGPPLRAIGDDLGRDSGSLTQLEAGIYVDPDGCHIWMIDDGLEGYWSRRRDPRSGLPVCTPIAPPNAIVGDIGADSGIRDRIPRR
ncbi:hypothetical protein [Rhodophyticola porphyridii]|uniref:Uncharacterized protein n=1 Tax=Rhodophyticola porphyridii TaxID=1852017 RepID=A0A3L9YAB1_9RHOB|nr:hypothetical protein D9R08_03405 [Rhodophyticola porphyridii]